MYSLQLQSKLSPFSSPPNSYASSIHTPLIWNKTLLYSQLLFLLLMIGWTLCFSLFLLPLSFAAAKCVPEENWGGKERTEGQDERQLLFLCDLLLCVFIASSMWVSGKRERKSKSQVNCSHCSFCLQQNWAEASEIEATEINCRKGREMITSHIRTSGSNFSLPWLCCSLSLSLSLSLLVSFSQGTAYEWTLLE